jgi:GNAT superfamily N-acetyltransferase
MMNIIFRSGLGSDAPELTKIAFAAKRHWDYPEEWIDLWADELTVDSRYVDVNWVMLAVANSQIVGWCAVSEERDEFWLDSCWVFPGAAGKGVGRALVRRALDFAAESHSRTLKVISDPNAEGFYRRLGFRSIGDHPSKPDGRRLPLLEANVASAA